MDLSQQTERCYQKQPTIFENKKRVLGARRVNRSELRFTRNVGLGFKAPAFVSAPLRPVHMIALFLIIPCGILVCTTVRRCRCSRHS